MSTPVTPAAPAPVAAEPKELRIYGHTELFYWWPVWATGYLMALLTWTHGTRLVVAPAASEYDRQANVIKLPTGTALPLSGRAADLTADGKFIERVHPDKRLGVIFTFVLFLVVLITNVPLRGVSSAVAIVVILLVIVSISALDWWDHILEFFGNISIHMNMGFYVFISTLIFLAWAAVFFGYDRLSYWRVTKGQITHEFVFGGGEGAFDTEGMAFQKLRDDLFRHWVLGLGSGDMIMHPLVAGGASKEELQILNVLFINTKLRRIQDLIATQPDRVAQ